MSCTACATLKPSTILGFSIGATVGSLADTIIGSPQHSVRGAIIGASVGTIVGGTAGIIYDAATTKPVLNQKTGRVEVEGRMPSMSIPEVSCIEVPSRIDGNKFIKKHEVCTIEKGSVWMME